MSTRIVDVIARYIRFPTSSLDGSDAMHPDPDYSAAYVVLLTDRSMGWPARAHVYLRRGTELCVAAAYSLAPLVGQDAGGDYRQYGRALAQPDQCDGQLRWVGPEKVCCTPLQPQ